MRTRICERLSLPGRLWISGLEFLELLAPARVEADAVEIGDELPLILLAHQPDGLALEVIEAAGGQQAYPLAELGDLQAKIAILEITLDEAVIKAARRLECAPRTEQQRARDRRHRDGLALISRRAGRPLPRCSLTNRSLK